jgi:uncharacterized protein YggE
MKTRIVRAGLGLIAGLALCCHKSSAQAPKPIPSAVALEYPPTLTVSGRAEVFATPDRAIVRLGAQAQTNEAAKAQSAVNQTIAKALAEIEKLGVEQRSIRTVGLNLFPGGVAIEPPQPLFARAMRSTFDAAKTPVQPGELKVEASVTLRYEVVP